MRKLWDQDRIQFGLGKDRIELIAEVGNGRKGSLRTEGV